MPQLEWVKTALASEALDTPAVKLEIVPDTVDGGIALIHHGLNGALLAPLDDLDGKRVGRRVKQGHVLGANHHNLVALREQLPHDECGVAADGRSH